MTRADFDHMVRSVEDRYSGKPDELRRRTLLWALQGLAVHGLPVVLGLLVGGVFTALAWAVPRGEGWVIGAIGLGCLGYGFWSVARSVFAKTPPPDGIRVQRKDAPELFAMLDELQRAAVARPFDGVYLVGDFNAAVRSRPTLGWLAGSRSWLILGLPLLDALSPAELRAVLAHELAHHSAKHGRLGNWLYRTRRSWETVFSQWNQRGVAKSDHRLRFARWFWPRFNAHAFVLSRTCEYEADAFAARLAGPAVMASALHRLALGTRRMDSRILSGIWKDTLEHPVPPAGVFERIASQLAMVDTSPDAAFDAVEVFRQNTGNHDTHPCLRDRHQALGFSNGELPPPTPVSRDESAARAVFGAELDRLRSEVEAEWKKKIGPIWTAQHRGAAYHAETLSKPPEIPDGRNGVNAGALWDRAATLMAISDSEEVETAIKAVLAARPDHPRANLALGERLLQRRDEHGIARVESAMKSDPSLKAAGIHAIGGYYHSTGQLGKLKELEAHLDREDKSREEGNEDLTRVSPYDRFIPVNLDASDAASFQSRCSDLEGVEKVVLAEKELPRHATERLFVIVVYGKRSRWGRANRDAEEAAVRRLFTAIRLPGRVFACAAHGTFARVAEKIATVQGVKHWTADGNPPVITAGDRA